MAKNSTKAAQPAGMDDWQAAEDCRTLARAREIKKDPKRLKAAQEYAQAQMVAAAGAAADLEDNDD